MGISDKEELNLAEREILKNDFMNQWLAVIARDLAKNYDNEKSTLAKCEIAKVLIEIKQALK